MKNRVNFIIGEMGGVGKSTFAKVLFEFYLNERKTSVELFDLDNSKYDVGLLYAPQYYHQPEQASDNNSQQNSEHFDSHGEQVHGEAVNGTLENNTNNLESRRNIYFTEDKKRKNNVDKIIDLAIKTDSDIIVNTPANMQNMLTAWFTESELLSLLKDERVGCYFWFVSNGSSDSFNSFRELHQIFKNSYAKVILVKNLHFLEADFWDNLLVYHAQDIRQILEEENFSAYNFQELDYQAKFIFEQNRIPFGHMISKDSQIGTVMDRRRVGTFLTLNYEQLNTIFKSA